MNKIHVLYGASLVALLLTAMNTQAANLMETYQLAVKNDPQWAAQKSSFYAEEEIVNQALAGLLPNAKLDASAARTKYKGQIPFIPGDQCDNVVDAATLQSCIQEIQTDESSTTDYNQESYSLNVTQPLLHLDRWQGYKKSKNTVNSAQATLAYGEQELIIKVAEAYFGILRAEEQVNLSKSEVGSLGIQLKEIKNRYKLGLVLDTDVFEAQASHDLAKASLITYQTALVNSKEDLRLLTRQGIINVNELPRNIPITPPSPEGAEQWEDFATKNNHQIVAAQFAVDASGRDVQEKLMGHAPTMDLFANYNHTESGNGPNTSGDMTTYGITINLPIYSGGATSSRHKQAVYKHQEAKDKLSLAHLNAIRETRQYYQRVMSDVENYKARKNAVSSNNKSYEAIKQGYESGLRTLTDLLNTQKNLYQARKDLASSRYDYILDTLKLKKSAGTLNPDDLEALNSWLENPLKQAVNTKLEITLPQRSGNESEREIQPFDDDYDDNGDSDEPGTLYDAFKAWKNGQD